MANTMKRGDERRCRATNRHGQRCRVTKGLGADGLCVMHSGKVDPREMGRKGGSTGRGNAQRRGAIEKTPELRAVLRTLDPHAVKAGLEEILAGGNQGAKVSAIKLLSDLEIYRQGDQEDWRSEMASSMAVAAEEFRRKVEHRAMVARDQRRRQLVDLLEPIGLAELADEDEDKYQLKIVRELARRLGAIPEHVLAEFSA
jgi:hypothetical protein